MSITQRFFLTNTAAGYTPATIRGAWDQTTSAVVKLLGRLPSGSATTLAQTETSTTNLWDVLFGRWVSDPLDVAYSFTASDKAQLCAGLKESSTSANDFIHVHIYVTQGDTDTPRGTLLTDSIGATEFTTTAGFRTEGQKTLSSVSALAGDRIVVEVGYQAQNTVSTSFSATLNYGGTQKSGISAATNVTAATGWVEFTLASHPFKQASLPWNINDGSANGSYSDNNLLVTIGSGAGSDGSGRAVLGRSAGKYVFALRIKKTDGFGPQCGVSTTSLGTSLQPGNGATAIPNAEDIGVNQGTSVAGDVWCGNSQIVSGANAGAAAGVGDTFFFAFDIDNRKWYNRVNNDPWFGFSGTGAVPDSGTNPFDFSGDIAANKVWYPTWGNDGGGTGNTIEFDASAYGHGLTTFLPWDSPNCTANIVLDAVTISAAATVTAGGGVTTSTGTLALTLSNVTISATDVDAAKETLAVTLDAATISAATQLKPQASLAVTLDLLTISASDQVKPKETLSVTLSDASINSASNVKPQASLSQTLSDVAISAIDIDAAKEQLAITLDVATISSAAKIKSQSTLTQTLTDVTVSSSNQDKVQVTQGVTLDVLTIISAIQGKVQNTLAVTLDFLTISATATDQQQALGIASVTLDVATISAAAQVKSQALLAVTLDLLTSAATGIDAAKSAIAISLADITVISNAVVKAAGSIAATLDALQSASIIAADISSNAGVTLVDCVISSIGNVYAQGTFAKTLADCIMIASLSAENFFSVTPRYDLNPSARDNDIGIVDRIYSFTAAPRVRSFTAKLRSFTFAPKPRKDGN